MKANLWDRARMEQLTRRGERSNDPRRVQRLTDTLHECRTAGESAEMAIRGAMEYMRDDPAASTTGCATARAILSAWIDAYGQPQAQIPFR